MNANAATLSVPHLTTTLSGPLLQLEQTLLDRQAEIEAWLRRQWIATPAPFYASADLRNSGFKVAPVDTNLFPAGFNNLNPDFEPLCIHALQSAVERVCPTAGQILIIPESHTRNQFYLASVSSLATLLRKAGFDVRIGSLSNAVTTAVDIEIDGRPPLRLEPVSRHGDELRVGDFRPCSILLNNDLSAGRPTLLEGIVQPIIPPLALGWSSRLKSGHFTFYREVAAEFGELLDIDPWLVDPMFRSCGKINFMKREGEECLASNVEALLEQIQAKYDTYGIDREPFVVIKAEAGTYGMGIMTARSPDDVRDLNRKQRTKMAATKDGRETTGAILQEGVYTNETWGDGNASAEPVVYMIDHYVIGGFYRVHAGRGNAENLNAPGMKFHPLAFAETCSVPNCDLDADAQPNRFYAYGVVARLALLAAAREIAGVSEITSA